jgi:hypothetical protein
MAIQTRYNGDAKGVTNVDVSINGVASAGVLISTGIGKHPTVFKLTAAADLSGEMGVGGKVEKALRVLQLQATTIAYQVNTTQLAVLVEATGWVDDATLLAALGADFTAVDFAAGLVLA